MRLFLDTSVLLAAAGSAAGASRALFLPSRRPKMAADQQPLRVERGAAQSAQAAAHRDDGMAASAVTIGGGG